MSAKFDEEVHNSLFSIMFTSLFPYMSIVTSNFDLWPPKSIELQCNPLTMANMSAKFDEEAQNGLVSIMFTSLLQYICLLWPWPLTSDLQNQ